ncbi:TfoX/Sxy family protein [Paenibacillus sp.]|uniref:TfoX/Sxy family protein n=1 Tax=Paenibacillus sp. TaxID=58172 RepID=UPI002811F3A8|nr:TfoX/Sxy family protein [Paenibacillus sp.]
MTKSKLTEESKAFFASVAPVDPRVTIKPMFGALGGFLKGNMFIGLYGDNVFVRLPEPRRQQALEAGATPFAPMGGRAMKEYVSLPASWREQPEKVEALIAESLVWAETLPEKLPGKRKGN